MKKIVIITVLLQVLGITTACTNMVSFDIDDNGVAREIVFPKITILCSKRTRHANSERIKSPFINELGIFHGTDTHRIWFSQ